MTEQKLKDSDNWQTPQWLFDKLNKEFNFKLDVCAQGNNEKCAHYIDNTENNGGCLTRDWKLFGQDSVSCFLNPPYSCPEPFVKKAWEESQHCVVVCLLKVDPSTRWWRIFWDHEKSIPRPGCKVIFLNKRIKFVPPKALVEEAEKTGKKFSGPTFPTAVVIMDRRNNFSGVI